MKIIDTEADDVPLDLFSYAALTREDEAQVREAAERIKLRLRRTAEDIIEIGKDLIAVKDRLAHGQFLPWLDAEFGMAERTARNFMNVADKYASKSAIVADLPPTALYELAAPKTPNPESISLNRKRFLQVLYKFSPNYNSTFALTHCLLTPPRRL